MSRNNNEQEHKLAMNNSTRERPNNIENRALNLYHKLNSKRSSTLTKETSQAQ